MKYLLVLSLAVMVFACEMGSTEPKTDPDSKATSIETLKAETIALHDEVMPLLGKMKQLQKQLNQSKPALVNTGSYTDEQVSGMITNLMKADEGMMQWMRDYGVEVVQAEGGPTEAVLEKFKASISQIKEDTFAAIAAAESALNLLKS